MLRSPSASSIMGALSTITGESLLSSYRITLSSPARILSPGALIRNENVFFSPGSIRRISSFTISPRTVYW